MLSFPHDSTSVIDITFLYIQCMVFLFVAVKKKLQAIAKVKGCEEVIGWIRSISNHLYWSAASTEGNNGEMILSKWKSMANHIQNIHSGHEGPFHQCEHEELTDRKWLKPGTCTYHYVPLTSPENFNEYV